jgi:hypothetical protein
MTLWGLSSWYIPAKLSAVLLTANAIFFLLPVAKKPRPQGESKRMTALRRSIPFVNVAIGIAALVLPRVEMILALCVVGFVLEAAYRQAFQR